MSPLELIQEHPLLCPAGEHYPWRVLVVCALLNLTQGAQVRPMLPELWRRCPDPTSLLVAGLDDLLAPLGLQYRRRDLLQHLTWDYLAGHGARSHGCGQYARDAWTLFVEGDLPDHAVADHKLRPYFCWRAAGGPAHDWKE